MTYAFVFTGEFGYELFNWQGVVRKWVAENKKSNDKIVICSRAGLESIYEFADHYINISQVESYNNTVADCYRGYVWEERDDLEFDDWPIIGSGPVYNKLVDQIKLDIQSYTNKTVTNIDRWIWSHDYEEINGCHFGHGGPGGGSIYSDGKFLPNNQYVKIKLNNVNEIKSKLQKQIDINLDKPFILCQTGYRAGAGYTRKSKVKVDINFNNETMPVLFLNFNSGRYWDSTSKFNNKHHSYSCTNFNEQACLILLASKCIYTTEGDFRSHTYIPPMLGKDVHVIASREVLQLPSAAVNFWNNYIFKFGGQMSTTEYEQIKDAI